MLEDRRKKGNDIGTARVDITNVEQVHLEARSEGFNITIDEPPNMGGTDKGLHPTGYFLVGVASIFLTQLSRVVIIRNLKIDNLGIVATEHHDRVTRRFTDIAFDITLTGSENKDTVIELLHEAQNRCFAHQSLKGVIPLTSNLNYNGTLLVSHTLGPESISSKSAV